MELRGLRDARIAIAGFFVQYGLYGCDRSNHVGYVGELLPSSELTNVTTCESWREAVNERGFDYVVGMPLFPREVVPLQVRCTADSEGADEFYATKKSSVHRIVRPLDPSRC
ncbi:MAG: hypothetical protein WD826_00895 [Actinomycetota bacterium]